MSTDGATPTDGTPTDGTLSADEGAESGSAQDQARRKFREALERKKNGHHATAEGRDPSTRAPHSSPAKPSRTFRRKSGG